MRCKCRGERLPSLPPPESHRSLGTGCEWNSDQAVRLPSRELSPAGMPGALGSPQAKSAGRLIRGPEPGSSRLPAAPRLPWTRRRPWFSALLATPRLHSLESETSEGKRGCPTSVSGFFTPCRHTFARPCSVRGTGSVLPVPLCVGSGLLEIQRVLRGKPRV